MKNLGITKVVRKSKTRIERTTKDSTFAVERDEGVLIPRPELGQAWTDLERECSLEMFLGEGKSFIDDITSVEFLAHVIEGDKTQVELIYITCKGSMITGVTAEFSNAKFSGERTLQAAERVYKEAADYFDGKNAQTEFKFSAVNDAQGDEEQAEDA